MRFVTMNAVILCHHYRAVVRFALHVITRSARTAMAKCSSRTRVRNACVDAAVSSASRKHASLCLVRFISRLDDLKINWRYAGVALNIVFPCSLFS